MTGCDSSWWIHHLPLRLIKFSYKMVFSPRLNASGTKKISYCRLHRSHTLWNSLVFHSFVLAIMSPLIHKYVGSWPVFWWSKIRTLIKASIRCIVTKGTKKLTYYWPGILLWYCRINYYLCMNLTHKKSFWLGLHFIC